MKLIITILLCIACISVSNLSHAKIPDIILAQKEAVVTIYIEDKGKVIAFGSGFMIDDDGTIVTNHHVIKPWEKSETAILYVKRSDGTFFEPLKIVSSDEGKDVAIIRIKEKNLQFIKMANDYNATQGEDVVVIGTPLGFETTVTDGIVSGIRGNDGFLQISAPVSPGSSGSPVLNSKGEAIGVATLVMTGGQNLNFAIPVSYVTNILAQENSSQPKGLRKTSEVTSTDSDDLHPMEIPAGAGHKGKVLQAMDAGKYTYLDVEEKGQRLWIAVMSEAIVQEGVTIGDTIEFPDSPPMIDFESKGLGKTFDKVMFSAGLRKVISINNELTIDEANKAIELNPNNAELYYKRAKIYLLQREYSSGTSEQKAQIMANNNVLCANALTDLNSALELNISSSIYFATRAELLTDTARCEYNAQSEGIKDYENAIKLDQKNSSYYVKKGWLHNNLKNMPAVLECAKKAVALSPKTEDGYYLYGTYYVENKNYSKALEYFKKGLSVSGDVTFGWVYVDGVMDETKKYDDAVKLYTDLIRANPKKELFYSCRADYYSKSKAYRKSVTDYTTAIELNPNNSYYYRLRADSYYNDGNKVAALGDYQKSCEMENNEACDAIPTLKADIRRGDNWIYITSGNACNYYYDNKSISKNKTTVTVWTRGEITNLEEYINGLNLEEYDKNNYKKASHNLVRFEFDCKNNNMKFIKSLLYSESGNVISSYESDAPKYKSIIPETIGSAMFHKVCNEYKVEKPKKK